MKDIQNEKDFRGLVVDQVGIENFKIPLFFGKGKERQQIVAEVKMGINLPSVYKGTHMSRFVEITERMRNLTLNNKLISDALKNIKRRLQSNYAVIEFSFIYFLSKKTPVTKKLCGMDYKCKIQGELDNAGHQLNYFEVEVPIVTLCPCSKEISRYGAHNQRAKVTLKMKTRKHIDLKDLIVGIEKKVANELYSILKRVDEKFVTEKMYQNPMFVEDIVREITLWIKNDKKISDFIISCKSYESVHNHNVFAIIINNEKNANN